MPCWAVVRQMVWGWSVGGSERKETKMESKLKKKNAYRCTIKNNIFFSA